MVSTALGLTAASWAVVMALSPILQVREMRRRNSSEGVSIGYFAVLLVGFGLWVSYGIASHDLPPRRSEQRRVRCHGLHDHDRRTEAMSQPHRPSPRGDAIS